MGQAQDERDAAFGLESRVSQAAARLDWTSAEPTHTSPHQ